MKDFDSAKPSTGRDRLDNLVDVVEWPEEYLQGRMIGPIYTYAYVWLTISTPKKKEQAIPKLCLDHDGYEDEMVGNECPYRKSGYGRIGKQYAVNFIVRDLQQDQKGRNLDFPVPKGVKLETHMDYEAYWAKKGDTRKTPVRILLIPESKIDQIKKFKNMNKVTNKKTGVTKAYGATHPDYGFDIQISEDKSKKGAAKYDIQKGDRTPLTDEELDYLLYRPDALKKLPLAEAKFDMKELEKKIVVKSDNGSAKKRRTDEDDDDSDIDDDVVDIDEKDLKDDRRGSRGRSRDDEDEKPARSSRGRSRDDDEDEKPAKRGRSRDDEDEDVDLDEDLDNDLSGLDGDDDEDKPTKRCRSRDDDDEDERPAKRQSREDDDDRPARRSSSHERDEEAPRSRRRA